MKLSQCGDCGAELGEGVVHCPYCPSGVRMGHMVWHLVLIAMFIMSVMYLVAELFGGVWGFP